MKALQSKAGKLIIVCILCIEVVAGIVALIQFINP
jgi:hypothetical protein